MIYLLYPNPDLLRYRVPQHSIYNIYHGFATIDRSTLSSDLHVSLFFCYTYLIKWVSLQDVVKHFGSPTPAKDCCHPYRLVLLYCSELEDCRMTTTGVRYSKLQSSHSPWCANVLLHNLGFFEHQRHPVIRFSSLIGFPGGHRSHAITGLLTILGISYLL